MTLGYNINTGKRVESYEKRMVHVGLGFYVEADQITPETELNREMFLYSIDRELLKFKLGLEEK